MGLTFTAVPVMELEKSWIKGIYQVWRTFLRGRDKIVCKFQRNPFSRAHGNSKEHSKDFDSSIIIIIYCINIYAYYNYEFNE
jgi:hypothetical protein